jgi:DNA-binding SARP family transcriptional activator
LVGSKPRPFLLDLLGVLLTNAATCACETATQFGWYNCAVPARPDRLTVTLSTIRLQLIGTPALYVAGRAPHRLERHDAALLAIVILSGPQPRKSLAELVWSDPSIQDPRSNLRQRLIKLRQVGGTDVLVGTTTIALADRVDHDLGAMLGDPSVERPLPSGDLLAGLDFASAPRLRRWVDEARERCRARRRAGFERRVLGLEAAGRVAEAIDEGWRWQASDFQAEQPYLVLARLHYIRGDHAGARHVLEFCLQMLREVSRPPSRQLKELDALVHHMDAGLVPRTEAVPLALLRPPRTIARTALLTQLEAAWLEADPVVIEGEAGVGKSRAVAEFVKRDANRVLIVARAVDRHRPYSLLCEVLAELRRRWAVTVDEPTAVELARIDDAYGEPAQGEFLPSKVLEAVARLFRSWQRCGLEGLVIENAHWVASASLEALLWLHERLREPQLRLVLTARDLSEISLLADRVAMAGGRTTRVLVPPLGANDSKDLIVSLLLPGMSDGRALAWATVLGPLAAGNPMHLLELLIAIWRVHGESAFGSNRPPLEGVEDLGGLHRLLEQRLGALGPDARHLAEFAALAGSHLSIDLLTEALDKRDPLDIRQAWAELEARGIFSRAEPAFQHELLRERVLASIPEPIARAVRGRIALAAEKLMFPPSQVAEHWFAAQQYRRAGDAYRRAAEAAGQVHRRAEEREIWDLAAHCFDLEGAGADAHDARRFAFDAALLTLPIGQAEERARELERHARSDAQRLAAAIAVLEVHTTRRDVPAALAESERVVALVERVRPDSPSQDARRLLRGMLLRGSVLALAGRSADAVECVEALQPWVEDGPDPRMALDWHQTRGITYAHAGRNAEAAEALERAAVLAVGLNDVSVGLVTDNWLAQVLARRGRHDAAAIVAARCETAYHLVGQSGSVAYWIVVATIGLLACRRGRYREGIERLSGAITALGAAGATQFACTCREHLARAYLQLGDPGLATAALGTWPPDLYQGRLSRALIELEIARERGCDIGADVESAAMWLDTASFMERTGFTLLRATIETSARALDVVANVLESVEDRGLESVAASALTIRVRAERTLGQTLTAAASAAELLRMLETYRPIGVYVIEAYLECFWALEAAGRSADARSALSGAGAWLIGAWPQVPEDLRESFVTRNRANRMLLEIDAVRGGTLSAALRSGEVERTTAPQ